MYDCTVPQLVILLVYTVANLWIGIDTWVFWANSIATLKNEGKAAPSSWAPVAKTCGQLLNINCALLIVRRCCWCCCNCDMLSGNSHYGWSHRLRCDSSPSCAGSC